MLVLAMYTGLGIYELYGYHEYTAENYPPPREFGWSFEFIFFLFLHLLICFLVGLVFAFMEKMDVAQGFFLSIAVVLLVGFSACSLFLT